MYALYVYKVELDGNGNRKAAEVSFRPSPLPFVSWTVSRPLVCAVCAVCTACAVCPMCDVYAVSCVRDALLYVLCVYKVQLGDDGSGKAVGVCFRPSPLTFRTFFPFPATCLRCMMIVLYAMCVLYALHATYALYALYVLYKIHVLHALYVLHAMCVLYAL